jgi:hypothetical protein
MADAARPARFDRLYEALKVLLVQERDLNQEAVELAAKIQTNFEEMGI